MQIEIIIPYLGKLTELGKISISQLDSIPNINIHVIVDDDSFDEINKHIIHGNVYHFEKVFKTNNLLNITTSQLISNPYKLCDFKPFFNLLFDLKQLETSKFWGWADIDCIFDIHLLNQQLSSLNKNSIYGDRGHFMIFSNDASSIVQKVFLEKISHHKYDLINPNRHFALDEFLFLHKVLDKLHKNNLIIWKKTFFSDILDLDYKNLIPKNYNTNIMFDFEKIYFEKKILYIHFQKRKFILPTSFDDKSNYYFGFDNQGNIQLLAKKFNNKIQLVYQIKYKLNMFFKRLINRIKNHSIFKRPSF